MRIKIHEHAHRRYVLSCYISRGRPQLNWDWAKKIEQIGGQWLEVETDYLFSDQFNTVPVEGVSEKGLRISNVLVAEIENDARLNPVFDFVDGILTDNPGLVRELVDAKWYNPLHNELLDKWQWVNTWKLATKRGFNLTHDDIDIADKIIHGHMHKCTPVEPLICRDNNNVEFYYSKLSDKYGYEQCRDDGVLDLIGESNDS